MSLLDKKIIVITISKLGELSGSSSDNLSTYDWCTIGKIFEQDGNQNLDDSISEYDDTVILWDDQRYATK